MGYIFLKKFLNKCQILKKIFTKLDLSLPGFSQK